MYGKERNKKNAKAKDLEPIALELLNINTEVEEIAKNLNLPCTIVTQLLLQREIVILNKQIYDLLNALKIAQKPPL